MKKNIFTGDLMKFIYAILLTFIIALSFYGCEYYKAKKICEKIDTKLTDFDYASSLMLHRIECNNNMYTYNCFSEKDKWGYPKEEICR